MPTEPKKVLCIHDLSGAGRCSLAVILPVLAVMGVQPVALPGQIVDAEDFFGFGWQRTSLLSYMRGAGGKPCRRGAA